MKTTVAFAAICGAAMTTALGDEVRPALSTNPFERPAWLNEAREVASPAPEARVRLDLRATLLGEPSLANVGGKILQPGDEVDGYTLLSVSDGAAEFSDGERNIRVTVRPQAADEAND